MASVQNVLILTAIIIVNFSIHFVECDPVVAFEINDKSYEQLVSYKPNNITVHSYYVKENVYTITIAWTKSLIDPESYTIEITSQLNYFENTIAKKKNIPGNVTSTTMHHVKITDTS